VGATASGSPENREDAGRRGSRGISQAARKSEVQLGHRVALTAIVEKQ